MNGINKVHLLGRCGQDPEIRTVGSNNVMKASFSLCTGGRYRTQDGREVDDSTWHNIIAWRNLAGLAESYIRKGSLLFVIGHLTYRRYTDSNGIEKSITEIVADRIELCGSRSDTSSSAANNEAQPPKVSSEPVIDTIGDLPPGDGLPF